MYDYARYRPKRDLLSEVWNTYSLSKWDQTTFSLAESEDREAQSSKKTSLSSDAYFKKSLFHLEMCS